jgi:hypothetical protein
MTSFASMRSSRQIRAFYHWQPDLLLRLLTAIRTHLICRVTGKLHTGTACLQQVLSPNLEVGSMPSRSFTACRNRRCLHPRYFSVVCTWPPEPRRRRASDCGRREPSRNREDFKAISAFQHNLLNYVSEIDVGIDERLQGRSQGSQPNKKQSNIYYTFTTVPNENSVRPASDAIPEAERKALADCGTV